MERLSHEESEQADRRNQVARLLLRAIPSIDVDLSHVVDGVTDTPEIIVRRLASVDPRFFDNSQMQQLHEAGIEV